MGSSLVSNFGYAFGESFLIKKSECPPNDANFPEIFKKPNSTHVYKIGRTMFETDKIPSGWIERYSVLMNEDTNTLKMQ